MRVPVGLRWHYVSERYYNAIQEYSASTFQGKIILIYGDNRGQDSRAIWNTVAPGCVTYQSIPCPDHLLMIDANYCEEWAQNLASTLAALSAEGTGRIADDGPAEIIYVEQRCDLYGLWSMTERYRPARRFPVLSQRAYSSSSAITTHRRCTIWRLFMSCRCHLPRG
jgi:hypothetical protein